MYSSPLGRGGRWRLVCELLDDTVRVLKVEHGSLGAIGGCRGAGIPRAHTTPLMRGRYERVAQAVCPPCGAGALRFRAY